MITKRSWLMHAIGLCDDTNASMSDRVKIPHVPYHICVRSELFLCIEMPVQSLHVFVHVWDSVTFQQWEQAWGWCGQTWPYPLCENFTILQHRESFVMRMGRHNSGIGQGVREVFLGDNVPTAKLRIYKDSITFSYLLWCKVLHTPCYLVGAGH